MITNNVPPKRALQQLIQGFQVSQVLYVATKLGIADLLQAGPRESEELALATTTHTPSLYRILRLLTTVGILTEEYDHLFALTSLGTYLQTGVPSSLCNTVLAYGDTVITMSYLLCRYQVALYYKNMAGIIRSARFSLRFSQQACVSVSYTSFLSAPGKTSRIW